MEALKQGGDALFILLGGIMVLAMHAGFAFLELGTVRKKNQVNALVKILVDFSVSTVVYFVVGYSVAYGTNFFVGAEQLAAKNGYDLVKFFFLLTFAAAIPAIVSGGIAERAKFWPQLIATACIVGFVYPFFEGIVWNQHFGVQAWIKATTGEEFHDFAGSVVVHAMGGWIAIVGLGYRKHRLGRVHSPGNKPVGSHETLCAHFSQQRIVKTRGPRQIIGTHNYISNHDNSSITFVCIDRTGNEKASPIGDTTLKNIL